MSETIIDASPSAHGYLVSPLTDHIAETDEGYLVVTGCPIARTGFQEYSVKDLNQDAARELGVDTSNPGAAIDLYRPASEVFAPEFLASLNGKSITDNHPPQFLNKDNQREFSMGHIQNPRKGDEPLENGEWPLVADLVITAEPLISKVRNKEQREVSLGYDYGIRRDGNKIVQCDLLGNHVAIVPKGRAGDLVSIQDAAPDDLNKFGKVVERLVALADSVGARDEPKPSAATRASPPAAAAAAQSRTVNATSTAAKEKKPVKITWKGLVGRGLRALAQDADVPDEDIAQAALEATEDRRRRGRDDDPAITAPEDADHEVDDRRARDRRTDDRHMDDRRARDRKRVRDYDDPTLDEPEDFDHEPAGDRRKMHDALDRVLDRRGEDTDLEELKTLLGEFLTEEQGEPEHAGDEETEGSPDLGDLERVVGETTEDDEAAPGEELVESGEAELEPSEDGHGDDRVAEEDAEEDDGEGCAECGAPMEADDAFCAKCGAEDGGKAKDRRRGKDRARAADGAMAVLRAFRPYAARSTDRAFKAAFNSALSVATRGSAASTSSYRGFAGAARARDKAPRRAQAADSAVDRNNKLQAAYDAALKGAK